MDYYMIVYPLPDNYKDTSINRQKVMEKFKKFCEKSKLCMKDHTLDHVYNPYKNGYKYVCLSSRIDRPEYYTYRPTAAGWEHFIILNEDYNNILIGEL